MHREIVCVCKKRSVVQETSQHLGGFLTRVLTKCSSSGSWCPVLLHSRPLTTLQRNRQVANSDKLT